MKKNIEQEKNKIRKDIAAKKQEFTTEDLLCMSEEVFSVLEIIGSFRDAKNIFIYNSMPDEVSTSRFIEKWMNEKNFYYPVVKNESLVFRKVLPQMSYEKSKIGIDEPLGEDFTDLSKVDLILVPGVAFDRKSNRLGRGKGYYDKYLNSLKIPKVGICFDFQLYDNIPATDHDVKMDMVVSENDLIW